MKKIKLFAAAAMIAMVATAGYFGYTAYEYANMTDAERMMQANIEALTTFEVNNNTCYNSITTKEGSQVRYCGTCAYVVNSTNTLFSGTGSC
ncbi:MAG: hypothetical protein SNJ28_08360 [Rikenellaceae bacterium]